MRSDLSRCREFDFLIGDRIEEVRSSASTHEPTGVELIKSLSRCSLDRASEERTKQERLSNQRGLFRGGQELLEIGLPLVSLVLCNIANEKIWVTNYPAAEGRWEACIKDVCRVCLVGSREKEEAAKEGSLPEPVPGLTGEGDRKHVARVSAREGDGGIESANTRIGFSVVPAAASVQVAVHEVTRGVYALAHVTHGVQPAASKTERIRSVDRIPEGVRVELHRLIYERVDGEELPCLRVVVAADSGPRPRSAARRQPPTERRSDTGEPASGGAQ